MQILKLSEHTFQSCLKAACEALSNGGLVIYPTETLYGIAVDATNFVAVNQLFLFKDRPAGKAISVLVNDLPAAERLVILNNTARNLYKTFLPGPLSVVSISKKAVDTRLESEYGTLAIRISSHPFASALAAAYGKPITATSANASGKARPYQIETALGGLSKRQKQLISVIIDAGRLPPNEPSTVIDTTNDAQELVRAGSASGHFLEQIATTTPEETEALAARLTRAWLHVLPYRPLVFALTGPLGAGKTQFAKGVARSLGITEPITSPSYTLVKEYPGFVHADLWRVPEIKAEEIGLPEYLKPGTVTVLEWADPLLPYLQSREDAVTYLVEIAALSEMERQISVREL